MNASLFTGATGESQTDVPPSVYYCAGLACRPQGEWSDRVIFRHCRRSRPSAADCVEEVESWAEILVFVDPVQHRNQARRESSWCNALPGRRSARDNVIDHSWDSVTAQEAVKLP